MFSKIKEFLNYRVLKKKSPFSTEKEGLVDFFAGNIPDDKGRLITDYHNFSFIEIEKHHDFIQWAFPTTKQSQVNPRAPLITEEFAESLQKNTLALNNYCLMCHRYLSHLGFNCKGISCRNCEIHEDDNNHIEYWKIPSHNYFRITRMLQSLKETGNSNCSGKVYEALLLKKEKENARINYDSLRFWKETQGDDDTILYSDGVCPIHNLRLWALRTYYKYRIEECARIGSTHGLLHWDRVYENGKLLIEHGVNSKVLAAFAYTHDVFRQNDDNDVDHGVRAAEMISSIRNTYLNFLNDEEFTLLCDACKLHTITQKTENATINACFDADRLDLWRVGIKPNPEQMATEKGAKIARTNVPIPMHK